MVQYVVGFEEEFAREVSERAPGAMNTYEAEQLQEEATVAAFKLLLTRDYAATVGPRGIISVDRPIDPEGHDATRKMFREFRIVSWDGQDKGAAPLLLKKRTLETLVAKSEPHK